MNTTYHNVHANSDGVFNTRSGLLVDLNYPTVDMIVAEDIAHALSRICRFGGHTMGHYSVAEHSILVASLAPENLKLEALLHDAPEAYLGDVIKPLKNILGSVYSDLEEKFELVISVKFDLERHKLIAIKEFDKQALGLEHEAYIKDDLQAFANIQEIIQKEIGGKYMPYQIPELFIKLLYQYGHARNM